MLIVVRWPKYKAQHEGLKQLGEGLNTRILKVQQHCNADVYRFRQQKFCNVFDVRWKQCLSQKTQERSFQRRLLIYSVCKDSSLLPVCNDTCKCTRTFASVSGHSLLLYSKDTCSCAHTLASVEAHLPVWKDTCKCVEGLERHLPVCNEDTVCFCEHRRIWSPQSAFVNIGGFDPHSLLLWT